MANQIMTNHNPRLSYFIRSLVRLALCLAAVALLGFIFNQIIEAT